MTLTTSVQPRHTPSREKPRLNGIVEPTPLHSGDRLARVEFERRYTLHPEIKKAELVEGVVYVPADHGRATYGELRASATWWLGVYSATSPGVSLCANTTARLDNDNEPQPDAQLRLEPRVGGMSRIDEDGYVQGPPELVVEVAASSASYDLGDKLRAYQRNGVREYLALQVYERRIDWFILREGVFTLLEPDEAGTLRSEVFPGLWLKPDLIWTGDLAGLLLTLQQGLASPEHEDFAARHKPIESI
jgi:hypothetical protein